MGLSAQGSLVVAGVIGVSDTLMFSCPSGALLGPFRTFGAGVKVAIEHSTWLDVGFLLASKAPSRCPKLQADV